MPTCLNHPTILTAPCLHVEARLLLESGARSTQSDNEYYNRAVAFSTGGFRSMQERSA